VLRRYNDVDLFPASDNDAEITNRQLLAECLQTGSVDAWQEFVRRFQPLISGVVAQVVRRNGIVAPALVDDLVQDTYVRLCADNYKLLHKFNGQHENSLFGYLKVTAVSVALDYFKSLHSQKRGGGAPSASLEEGDRHQAIPTPSASSTAEQAVLMAEIDRTLNKVTEGPTAERDRLIFRLYYQQGFTASDISEIAALKLTAKGVESLVYRIAGLIRQELAGKYLQKAAMKISGNLAASPRRNET
jgi:RNA polymerase sigma-70 factor (ECF subfamily)